jgi:hypothetical protein
VRSEGLGKLKTFIRLIGSRPLDLPACSIVPQPLRYRMLHFTKFISYVLELSLADRSNTRAFVKLSRAKCVVKNKLPDDIKIVQSSIEIVLACSGIG